MPTTVTSPFAEDQVHGRLELGMWGASQPGQGFQDITLVAPREAKPEPLWADGLNRRKIGLSQVVHEQTAARLAD
jgi:hypothetical protein